jgi:hypothetical protein
MRRRAVFETAAILMASGALMGFAVSYLAEPRYVAGATLNTVAPDARQLFRNAWSETLSQESLVPMIVESSAWKSKLDLIPMEDLLRQIREGSAMTSADLPGGVTSFTIEFASEDREAALETMRALFLRVNDNAARLKPRIEHLPRVREAGPNRGLFASVGMGCGLLAGLVVGWAALRLGEVRPPRSEPAASPPA